MFPLSPLGRGLEWGPTLRSRRSGWVCFKNCALPFLPLRKVRLIGCLLVITANAESGVFVFNGLETLDPSFRWDDEQNLTIPHTAVALQDEMLLRANM